MGEWLDLVATAKVAAIPAPALRGVTLAQWMLESGHGTSVLARAHANWGGLKWRRELAGMATKVRYAAHDGADDYAAFASPAAFIAGYWAFVGRSVYAGWQAHAADPRGFVSFLSARGYAGAAGYAERVMACLPAAEALLAATPRFVPVAGVAHRLQGVRPGGLEGAIVHYDAGCARGVGAARATLAGGAAAGHAYVTVGRNGDIYLPDNMDWARWGSHAGESRCPATGRTGVSRHYVGFEVNSPGLVHTTRDPERFVPWFDAVRDARGAVVLDGSGRATARDGADLYARGEVRHVAVRTGNVRAGAYVPFTAAQMEALTGALLWLRARYPETFRLERVFGHDEVAGGRKLDPGGALGAAGEGVLTMAAYRARLAAAWDQRATG